jgi:hypothetical protein
VAQDAGQHETGPGAGDWPDVGSASMHENPGAGHLAPGGARETAPKTGEHRVDAALRLLDRLPELTVSEHPGLFEQVHAQLTEVLGELDSGPGGPAS